MYKQGSIVLIPIPFTDLSGLKQRPVLILSNDMYNQTHEDIVVVAITSNVSKRSFSVSLENNDLSEGVLHKSSEIRADKIYTLSQDIVIKSFGKVTPKKLSQVRELLLSIIQSENTRNKKLK